MDTIKLIPEDSGNLEQIAISIQKIEKILETLTKYNIRTIQSANEHIPCNCLYCKKIREEAD